MASTKTMLSVAFVVVLLFSVNLFFVQGSWLEVETIPWKLENNRPYGLCGGNSTYVKEVWDPCYGNTCYFRNCNYPVDGTGRCVCNPGYLFKDKMCRGEYCYDILKGDCVLESECPDWAHEYFENLRKTNWFAYAGRKK